MSAAPSVPDRSKPSADSLWTGSENILVGIAPNFWAHVPMTIGSINGLKLIQGIHCWTSSDGKYHVPVSKCVLVGIIVNAVIRSSDGANLYVLDDGTGLIDCLAWSTKNENDMFHLPSLLPDNDACKPIGLGDVVKLFGKIQCVTIKQEHDSRQEPFVVREIMATMVERIDDANEETRHWRACAQREAALARDPTQFNALGYLKQLGPQITQQVQRRQHLPAKDDTLGEWRIFGTSCKCTMEYKEDLLYCHCVAKVESLDPKLVFRDALLRHLLRVQAMHDKALVFPYKGIKINHQLRALASSVIASTDKDPKQESKMALLIDRLLLNTIWALRNDGVLYLANLEKDEYMLISRQWVFEPYVLGELGSKRKSETSKNFINFQGAPYLSQVHREKILYVKRCVAMGATNSKEKNVL